MNENTPPSDEPENNQPEPEPAVIVYVTDGGFTVHIAGDLNPMHLAGVAWYLEKQAERGLAMLLNMQQQSGPKLVVPQGFTGDHLRKRN